MRVPAWAIFSLLVFGACEVGTEDPPPSAAAESCGRASVPATIDPRAGTWQLVVPEHENNEFGVPQYVSDLMDACESFVSLGHSVGRGGKASSNGPSELLTSAHGEAWAKHGFGIKNSFRDLARGAGRWVAVGHGVGSPGAIAVADSLDPAAWRQVFGSEGLYFNSVAYGSNTFVAVTNNGVATSRDGEAWSWVKVPSPAQYFEVAFGDGQFVVAGVGAVLSSSDGKSWREMTCEDDSMCQPPHPPPTSACVPGADCPDNAASMVTTHQLALQAIRHVGNKFYAFGASGQLESSDAVTFRRAVEIPDAAIGGALVRLLPAPNGPLGASLHVSEDDGGSWYTLPYEVVETVDCREIPCVAIPVGILAFVAD